MLSVVHATFLTLAAVAADGVRVIASVVHPTPRLAAIEAWLDDTDIASVVQVILRGMLAA